MALECPTKLYYTSRPDEFPNQMNEDTFLFELAKGGMQIGELAKFHFVDDPIASKITLDFNRDHAKSLEETKARLSQKGKVIIAEASFLYNNCFVRADIVIKREDDTLELFEVKAKSFLDGDDQFINEKSQKITSEWSPYLYDVAFQKWVIEKSTGKKVLAHLMVVDKGTVASVPGMARNFKVFKEANERAVVTVKEGLKKSDLGNSILRIINVDKECELIYDAQLQLSVPGEFSFTTGVEFLASSYEKDSKLVSLPTSRCRDCEFNASVDQIQTGKKSALRECWIQNGFITADEFNNDNIVLELWSGSSGFGPSPVSKLIDLKKFLLKDASRDDFDNKKEKGKDGMNAHERREIQIVKAKSKEKTPFVNQKGLEKTFKEWKFPYHFIDFETSATALPWFNGCRPYEPIAFQFSHHILHENGTCAHIDQFISFEPGAFPNFDFLRALKVSLEKDEGTVFRYHSHENSYLRLIRKQLISRDVPDKNALINFIDNITERDEIVDNKKKRVFGNRSMVDLYKVVLKYYYSPFAKGSNSLKQILPAAINDFPYLKEKYGKPIYGKGLQIESLNFQDKIWIEQRFQFDPYKTLEPVFKEYPTEQLDRLVEAMEEIGDGGSAMMAYNMLQYSEIPLDQRTQIKEALYKYCELDTMAMVMLYEGLKSTL
jgi:hypothetical protein